MICKWVWVLRIQVRVLTVLVRSAFEVDPGVKIVVDSISLALVRGSTIDYVTELIGSQFAIKDNPQAKGAGCGCGVSWEPNL